MPFTVDRWPTSDAGFTGGWAKEPSGALTFYGLVDDTSDADYIIGNATSGGVARRVFGYAPFAIPSDATGIIVSVITRARKASSGTCNRSAEILIGGFLYAAAGGNPTTAFAEYTETWATNPKTGVAWTPDEINGIGTYALHGFGPYSTDLLPYVYWSSCLLRVTYDSASQPRKTVSETLGLSDSVTHYMPGLLLKAVPREMLRLSDSVAYNLSNILIKAVSDTLGLSEGVAPIVGGNLIKAVSDTLGLSEGSEGIVAAQYGALFKAVGGSVDVQIRFPTGDNIEGKYMGDDFNHRTPASGGYYDKVDEDPPDDDATYVHGHQDDGWRLFPFDPFTIPEGATVLSVTVHLRCRMGTGTSAAHITGALGIGEDDENPSRIPRYEHDTPGELPDTTWVSSSYVWTTNPATGLPWTVDDVNGVGPTNYLLAFGIATVDIPTSRTIPVTQVKCEATYTQPQSLGLIDSVAYRLTTVLYKSVTDTLGLSDSVAGGLPTALIKAVTETLGLSESTFASIEIGGGSVPSPEAGMIGRNVARAYVAKLTMPDASIIYLCDTDEYFKAMRATAPLNVVILSVGDTSFSDISRASTISIKCANKRLNEQDGNPLATPIHFSDLIDAGLDRATLEVKVFYRGAVPLTADSWDSPYLFPVFRGRVKRPMPYELGTITVSATTDDQRLALEYPVERIGEAGGFDETRPAVPIVLGDTSAELLGYLDNVTWGRIRALKNSAGCPAAVYDPISYHVAVSSRYVDLDFPTVRLGEFPSGAMLDRAWELYVDSDHPNWTLFKILRAGEINACPMVRLNCDPKRTVSYNHEAIGNPNTAVNLTTGQDVAAAAPDISNSADAMHGCFFYVHADVPAGAQIEIYLALVQRETGGFDYEWGPITVDHSDMIGAGFFVTGEQFWDFHQWLVNDKNIPVYSIDLDWWFFAETCSVRVRVKRTDAAAGELIVRGLYALPVATLFNSAISNPSSISPYLHIGRVPLSDTSAFGTSGIGLPEGVTVGQAHPANVIKATLEDVIGIADADVDFEDPADFEDTAAWKLGLDLAAPIGPIKGLTLLADLQEQSTALLCIDPDGVYRLRLLARYGGLPTWQRYGRLLVFGQDVTRAPKIEPLGADWVQNVISVNYLMGEDGQYLKRAWVRGADSDDGEGNSLPTLEALSTQSIADWGERRMTLDAYAVRDKATAVGILTFLASYRMQPPSRVTFPMRHLASDLRIGQIVGCDPASFDRVILFNGQSWAGKYFQIESITAGSTDYTVIARETPKVSGV